MKKILDLLFQTIIHLFCLLRDQYTLLSCLFAYTFVCTRTILPCVSIRQSTLLWPVFVNTRSLIPCEIEVYPYLQTAICTLDQKSGPYVLHG